MYEITGESIKSATSIKIGQIFGEDTKRYKENVVNMQYPNFFISQLSSNINPDTRHRRRIDYFMSIRYRFAKDTTNITNLEQQLDYIALKLMTEFTEIQLERPVKVKEARYEKEDGVLHFFFNISIQIREKTKEEPKQENLEIKEEVL